MGNSQLSESSIYKYSDVAIIYGSPVNPVDFPIPS